MGTWFTSTSRSWARSPPAVVGGCWAAPSVNATPKPTRIPAGNATSYRNPVRGYHFLHTALDAHSRLAYTELLDDERKETAAAFWNRANAWFAECGITIRKVLTDNGSCYGPLAFKDALNGLEHRRTRPYRPQTNGKVERFHRTLADEWAYARLYTSDAERCTQFPNWVHTYNHCESGVAGLGLAGRVSGGRLALGCDSYNHSPRGCVPVDMSDTGAGGRR